METNDTENTSLPAAIVIAGLLIAGAVVWSNLDSTGAPQADNGAAQTIDIKNVKTDGNPFIGQVNAPVTIAFWSDFQCPYCKNFELNTLPDIIKNYVDTGKVKVIFMEFAFLGDDSTTAALYSQSIWKLYPSQYFAWRTAIYTAQDEEGNVGFGNAASIDTLNATIVGIDAAKVAADVNTNKSVYQETLDADKAEAGKVGADATPSFVIGTKIIKGAYPYADFQAAIDAVLAK